MKIVSFLVVLLTVFSSAAQFSYYFSEPLPSAKRQVKGVAEKYFGMYTTKDGTISYQFDADGLTIVSTTISSIHKETVRESSKYSVRNGYLFGIEKGDSVPCLLEDGSYFFGVRNFDRYVGGTSEHILTKTSNTGEYVLNVYDNGRYVPQLLTFNGKKLEISHFDYDGRDRKEFDFIVTQEQILLDGITLVILKPNETDFERVASQSFVGEVTLKR